MVEISADARRILEAFYDLQTRGGGERQTHTERAIAKSAGLDSPRASSAIEELTAAGYITTNMPLWEGSAALTSFKLSPQGRRVLEPEERPS